MGHIKPDTYGLRACSAHQPEFREPMWQYVNRRVSDWRIITGKRNGRVSMLLLIERIETSTASTVT